MGYKMRRRRVRNGEKEESEPEVKFMGHCFLCLRKAIQSKFQNSAAASDDDDSRDVNKDTLEEVPKLQLAASQSSDLLSTIKKVWPVLLRNNIGSLPEIFEEVDADGGEKSAKRRKVSSSVALFTSLPELCQFCGDVWMNLQQLLREVDDKLNNLRSIIIHSKEGGRYCWRNENFRSTLTSSKLGRKVIQDTLDFVDNLFIENIGNDEGSLAVDDGTTPLTVRILNVAEDKAFQNQSDDSGDTGPVADQMEDSTDDPDAHESISEDEVDFCGINEDQGSDLHPENDKDGNRADIEPYIKCEPESSASSEVDNDENEDGNEKERRILI